MQYASREAHELGELRDLEEIPGVENGAVRMTGHSVSRKIAL